VALLNNGAEDSKGDPLHREAYALLKDADARGVIRFVGNVEGREAMLGACDVLVADGFSGNVFLKGIEGTAMFMRSMLKDAFRTNLRTKLGYLLCKGSMKEMSGALDYRKVGGTTLLGITKPVVKAHGSSDAEAVASAIRQAVEAVNSGFCDAIRENVDRITLPREN
jgi:glycerol-3-phosphate acyltransferase PlsX